MPGQRIKFRGAYEPYLVTGVHPYDPSPVKPRSGPTYRHFQSNADARRTCSSCSQGIRVGDDFCLTRKGTSRHQQCP